MAFGTTFDRFDICEAYWCYAVEHHDGQWSKEYALHSVFERIRFKPRPNLSSDTLDENAREIFDQLVDGACDVRDRTK